MTLMRIKNRDSVFSTKRLFLDLVKLLKQHLDIMGHYNSAALEAGFIARFTEC